MSATFVQAKPANGNTQFSPVIATFDSAPTNGNLIIAIAEWSYTGTPISVTNDDGVAFSAGSSAAEAGDFKRCRIFYRYAVTSGDGAARIPTTGVAGESSQLAILEYAGVSGAPEASATSTTSGADVSITTVSNHALVVAAGFAFSDPGVGGSWNGRVNISPYAFERVVDLLDATPIGAFTGQFTSADAKCAVAFALAGGATTRGSPFGSRGTAFNGGRTFMGIAR